MAREAHELGPVKPETRIRMQAVGQTDTAPELRLRRALWARGLRYRLNRRIAGARPDLAFPGRRVAVFVDGCFWHGCPDHYAAPKTNVEFWARKVKANQARDVRNNRDLKECGWTVLRFWECEVNGRIEAVERVVVSVVSNATHRGPTQPGLL